MRIKLVQCFFRMQKFRVRDMSTLSYPPLSRRGMYRGCCSRRDGAGTAVKTGSWAGRTHNDNIPASSVLEFIGPKQ